MYALRNNVYLLWVSKSPNPAISIAVSKVPKRPSLAKTAGISRLTKG